MIRLLAFGLVMAVTLMLGSGRATAFETDVIPTSAGELTITFIGHGTLVLAIGDKVIHVDPWTKLADYGGLPKADLILVTHEHPDHLDPAAIQAVSRDDTVLVINAGGAKALGRGEVMKNGDSRTAAGFEIEAVPAYNIVHKRDTGQPFHPKGEGNGYVVTFGQTRVYVAGDTEDIPEMKNLKNIDVAFLPMNLPYTMTPEMAAKAAQSFMPKILYPYHFGQTDTNKLVKLLEGSGIEVRIRPMS